MKLSLHPLYRLGVSHSLPEWNEQAVFGNETVIIQTFPSKNQSFRSITVHR